MNPEQLRRKFLSFFENKDHAVVESSSVIPENDPTLLFTNAGMNQFKDVLLGLETRTYTRAVSVQKCIRAGGKHNDLDEVGKDGRHLTFFEMLGNWSFGDYWKEDAIKWAWEFLTVELDLDPTRLYVTIYKDDDESYAIWNNQIGLPDQRILRLGNVEKGDEENFWSMGDTGPCGPCTEIHYDLTPDNPIDFSEGYDDERILEIWNLVFTQYDRDPDGQLHELGMRSVDTGSGFERLLSVVNGSNTVFDTQLFIPIEKALQDSHNLEESSFTEEVRVISDHLKSILFALSDGAKFSNTGSGYVLRKMLRRACMAGHDMGIEGSFLADLSSVLADLYKNRYPNLSTHLPIAQKFIKREEEKFVKSLNRGEKIFTKVLRDLKESGRTKVKGEEMFDLHATYGLPPEVTERLADENNCTVDWQGYETLFQEHQEISKG